MDMNEVHSSLLGDGRAPRSSFMNRGRPVGTLLDIAVRDVAILPPDRCLGDAAHIMAERRISSIVVEDGGGHAQGIVTERNILHAMQSGHPPETPLCDAMSSPVVTVPETLDCQSAYQLCLREEIRHLVIVDADKVVTGVVSETDFRLHMNLAVLAGRRQVVSVMNRSVLSLPPETSLRGALNLMYARNDSCVVVTENGCPIGLVTERDVVRFYTREPECIAMPLREVMVSPVKTIIFDATINEAAARMLDADTRHLVVVDADGQLAGLVREHDLTRSVLHDLVEVHSDAESAFLHTLVDAIPDMVWLKDPDGVFLACNAAFERLFGAGESDIVGRTDLDFVDAERAASFRKHDLGAMASEGIHRTEEWLTFPGGAHGLFETLRSPMRDGRGRLIGVLSIARDITAAHQAQDALTAREQEFRSLAESSQDFIVRYDREGRHRYLNGALIAELGLADEIDVIGMRPHEVWPDGRYFAIESAAARVVASGETETIVFAKALAFGESNYFQIRIVPERNAAGDIIGTIAFGTDITDQKRMEVGLRKQRDFQATLLNAINDIGMQLMMIEDGKIIHVNNREILREFGYTDADIAAGTGFLDIVHPDDRARILNDHQRRVAGETAPTGYEVSLLTRDGQRREYEVSVAVVPGTEPVRVITVGRDITGRKRTEKDLENSLREFNELVARIPVGVYKLRTCANGEWSFEYVSPRWCEMMELEEADALSYIQVVFGRTHPEDAEAMLERMQEAIRTMQPFIWEGRIVREDGIRWLLIQSEPSMQENGDILWSGIVHDITERHLAEERHRLASSVFADSHEGIVITDSDARIVDVNEAFSRITGYEREDVLGRNPRMLKSGYQDSVFYTAMWHDIKQNGHWSGEVWNRRRDGEVYAEYLTISAVRNDVGKVTHYAGVFADITPLKEQEKRIEQIIHFDILTGLPNRTLMMDRLNQAIAQAQRSGSLVAVCLLDLDDFTAINEQYGPEAGDRLLVEISRNMQAVLRGVDTVARIAGDEFVLILPDLARVGECVTALNRLMDAISQPFDLDGRKIHASASIGITICPDDSADPDPLLRHADQAMCRAKQEGKNRYHLYNPEQDRQLKVHRQSVLRLATALQRGELVLYYQPKVNLSSGEVIGAEALIRWQHPERGILAPAEFLPMLKGTEVEISLGEWVIDTALTQIAAWKAAGLHVSVSVNISADHIMRPDFTQHLQAILARHPAVSPSDLELEILESSAISDMESATRTLELVSGMGLSFALDDFGTGYSSLSYFSKLPVDVLKIDQHFVRNMLVDPENLSIVESIIFLSNSFHRPAVAEGVETLEHCAMLLHLGCSFGQGYGIAQPMPAERFPAWTKKWQAEEAWRKVPRISLPKEDVVLLVAESSHRQWVENVAACMENPACDIPPLHKRQCRFGRWFHGNGHGRYGHLPAYAALGPVHEQVHDLASELLDLAARGASEEACVRLPELFAQRDRFIAGLEALIGQVMAG